MTEPWTAERAAAASFRNREEGEKYLDRLLASCKDTAAGISRLVITLVLCMTAFEMLNRSWVDTVSITGFQIRDLTPVITFLPVVVAFLQYQMVRQMMRWRSLERTFRGVLKIVQPGVEHNQLGVYLVPTIPLFSTNYARGSYLARVFSIQHRIEGVFAAICAYLLPLFQVYAFFELYRHGQHTLTPILVTAITLAALPTLAYLVTIGVPTVAAIQLWTYNSFCREGAPLRRRITPIFPRLAQREAT